MRRFLYFYIFIVSFLTACNQQINEEFVESEIISGGYINFNAGVNTRAGVVLSEILEDDFSVLGYEYPNKWSDVEVQAKPNKFYNQRVVWDGEEGVHNYDVPGDEQLLPWVSGNIYSFFAFYPHTNKLAAGASILINDENSGVDGEFDEADYEGIPYIIYTMPTNDENVPEHLEDVMTAHIYDTNNQYSNAVTFYFTHRLTALDVEAQNFNPLDSETGEKIYIDIKSLSMKIESLNNQAKLYLDADIAQKALTDDKLVKYKDVYTRTVGNNWTPTYTLVKDVSSSLIVPPNNTDEGKRPTSLTNHTNNPQKTLVLIPKIEPIPETENYIKGEVTVLFQYVDENGQPLEYIDGISVGDISKTKEFTIDKPMLPGRKYSLQLNFSRSSITIGVVESNEWTEDINVEHEFE